MSAEDEKERAAAAALDLVEPGMRLGLGTGSTAACFVRRLGERVADGLEVLAVPTSEATAELARSLSVPLAGLDDLGGLDLTVDGADEIDGELNLIKGGGGALLREKIVASASREMVVIADSSKRVARLGHFPLAVEIVTFASRAIAARVSEAAAEAGAQGGYSLRLADDDTPFLTDSGHHIYDYAFGGIAAPSRLAAAIGSVPGVVEHGLFIGLARKALIGTPDGVETLQA